MTIDDTTWRSVRQSIQEGTCIVSLGPGLPVPQPNGPPVTLEVELSRRLAATLQSSKKIPHSALPVDNLPLVAQKFLRHYVRDELATEAASFYAEWDALASGPDLKNSIFGQLATLPIPTFITLRHDNTLARALCNADKTPHVQFYSVRGERQRTVRGLGESKGPLVYHLLGSAGTPRSLAITETDLLNVVEAVAADRPPFPYDLRNCLADHSILFLGCGLHQYYVRVLLHLLRIHKSEARSLACETSSLLGNEPPSKLTNSHFFYSARYETLTQLDVECTMFVTELRRRWSSSPATVQKS